MKKYVLLLLFILIFGCTTIERLDKTPDFITEENYFNFRISESGIKEHLFDHTAITDTIIKYLKKKGFVVIRDAIFQLKDGTIIPVTGYLPYQKVGFFVETTVSYPKNQSMRNNAYCDYCKYGADSIGYLFSFKDDPNDNLFVFKSNWYWWQTWETKNYERINKDKVLISEDFAHKLLLSDIEKAFGKYKPRNK